MSLYRVHFKWKDKDLTLRASGLDLTHPYFVSITGLVFPDGKKLIIDPTEDEVRRTFGRADHLMLPFQTVTLIEEIKDAGKEEKGTVRDFRLIDESDGAGDPDTDDSPDNPEA